MVRRYPGKKLKRPTAEEDKQREREALKTDALGALKRFFIMFLTSLIFRNK